MGVAIVTAIALAALAVFGNYAFIFSGAPVEILAPLYFNAVLLTASYFAIPCVQERFARGQALHTQSEKEGIIDGKTRDLEYNNDEQIIHILNGLDIQPHFSLPHNIYGRKAMCHLLARAIYYDNRSKTLSYSAQQLRAQNKLTEAVKEETSAAKAKIKAAFFVSNFYVAGKHSYFKFKDAFTWVDAPPAEQSAPETPTPPLRQNILHRRGDPTKMLSLADVNTSVGELGQKFVAMLA